jgi:hypothetical protein
MLRAVRAGRITLITLSTGEPLLSEVFDNAVAKRSVVVLVGDHRGEGPDAFPPSFYVLQRAGSVLVHAWPEGARCDYLEAATIAQETRVHVIVETQPGAAATWREAVNAAGDAPHLTILPPAAA